MKGQTHICENCGQIYPCPEKIDLCEAPKRFGNCSLKCKMEDMTKHPPKMVVIKNESKN